MIKGLLALDENLESSIALRYASQMAEMQPMQLQVGHVEQLAGRKSSGGSQRGRRSMERELEEIGRKAIERLLNTEKVPCPFVGAPKVLVGRRDDVLLNELRQGGYDLFMEGNLNTSDSEEFYRLVSSRLYAETPCPILVIKNLVPGNRVALLGGDDVDYSTLIAKTLDLVNGATSVVFDLLYYRPMEQPEPLCLPKEEAGEVLAAAEIVLQSGQRTPESSGVLCGSPEQVAEILKKYRVVATSFPATRNSRMELLARCPSPLLLCS